ncbi:hypothetical protein RN001_006886 [Aquatica leii]|uniref:Chromatin assembly factor 1 subunit A n=1 Tax=Aquatica leii TaxID=1421715 RepID=A0AAN7Q6I3_9COLE|nr:hypothetical protein RN001_006886 [Aquatica leii]
MFGLSLPCQLIQGPAVRTWNCVAHFANLLWCKFNHIRDPTMPRSRRRHHSRSRTRSRSRSHSCDRDRDTKRRKIDNYESPHKRSDSPEDDEVVEVPVEQEQKTNTSEVNDATEKDGSLNIKTTSGIVTPNKPVTPKQLQKKLLSEEKKKERDRIKEEKLKLLEEKKKIKQEEHEKRMIEKQKKTEQKQKEMEEKQKIKDEKKKKELEEKEMKRKEKEEKEEQKRKEQMEKSMEKQKLAEKKEKTAAAFVNFFTKKSDAQTEEKIKETTSTFMPFEVKSDMRLAPRVRTTLDDCRKLSMLEALKKQDGCTYLDELKSGRKIGKSVKTWPITDPSDDVVIVEDVNPGESIEEQVKIVNKARAKFFKFDGNRRPAYFGTWRKKSSVIKPRKPFEVDNVHFNYDVDSDEDWEEDDSGESLRGSDDDKENDSGNEYEEDNEFFVPHGHLSDDEGNDEDNVSPEAHKAKLKLLKKAFEEEMRSKTEKIKPRVIGCIWYNKDGSNVDSAIDSFLKPLSIISNGPVVIKKRTKFTTPFTVRRSFIRGKELDDEFIPAFLKFVHGSTTNSKALATEFLNSLEKQNLNVNVSKTSLVKKLKRFASWTRCPEGEPALKKYCWFVHKNFSEEYNVDLPCLNN